MVDSIHIVLNRSYIPNQNIVNLIQILTNKKVTTFLDEDKTYIKGNYKNFNICVFPANLTLNGSLPKFLYGHNLSTLSHSEIISAIKKLSVELGLPIAKGHISRIDIADNFVLNSPVIKYFPWMLETPKYARSRTKSLKYNKNSIELTFYDKTEDALKNCCVVNDNILRIELRIKKNVRRTLGSKHKLFVVHLFASSFYKKLVQYWYFNYQAIIKKRSMCTDPIISGWKGLQNYLTASYIIENEHIHTHEHVCHIADENNWNTRTRREVKQMLLKLYNSNFTKLNRYIQELDTEVEKTFFNQCN